MSGARIPPRADVAIVTGGAGSVGRAIVASLADDGFRVIAIDRSPGPDQCFPRNNRIEAVQGDLGTTEGLQQIFHWVEPLLADVRVLVNNAGILTNNKLSDTTPEEWRQVMAINLDAAFFLSRLCLPSMRQNRFGRIVNMCSLAMKTGGLTAGTAYSVSKGALGTLTLSLARETAADGITVNAIAPAYVRSPMITEQLTEDQRQVLARTIPVGRFCEPEEVAHAVAFLVSPLSGFITGEILDINGGLHLD